MTKQIVTGLITALMCLSMTGGAAARPDLRDGALVAQTATLKKMKSPIYPGVEPGFEYNVLLETDKAIGGTSMHTILLEFVKVSLTDALQRLDTNLVAQGFKKNHEQIVKGSTIRNYLNAAGDSVHVQVSAYKPGAAGKVAGSKGTMNITVRKPEK